MTWRHGGLSRASGWLCESFSPPLLFACLILGVMVSGERTEELRPVTCAATSGSLVVLGQVSGWCIEVRASPWHDRSSVGAAGGDTGGQNPNLMRVARAAFGTRAGPRATRMSRQLSGAGGREPAGGLGCGRDQLYTAAGARGARAAAFLSSPSSFGVVRGDSRSSGAAWRRPSASRRSSSTSREGKTMRSAAGTHLRECTHPPAPTTRGGGIEDSNGSDFPRLG